MSVKINNKSISSDDDAFMVRRAKDHFRKIEADLWDYSDSILMWNKKGVEAYISLNDHTHYSMQTAYPEKKLLDACIPIISKIISPSTIFIELGPGTAEKTVDFLKKILSKSHTGLYYGVEISKTMAKIASQTLSKNNIEGEIIIDTFDGALSHLQTQQNKFVFSLGFTLFNEGMSGLQHIKTAVAHAGTAFFSVEIKDRLDMQKMEHAYCGQETIPFHQSRLELIELTYGDHVSDLRLEPSCSVSVKVQKLNSFLLNAGAKIGDRIIIGKSYKPTMQELTDFFENDGFTCNLFDFNGPVIGVSVSRNGST